MCVCVYVCEGMSVRLCLSECMFVCECLCGVCVYVSLSVCVGECFYIPVCVSIVCVCVCVSVYLCL